MKTPERNIPETGFEVVAERQSVVKVLLRVRKRLDSLDAFRGLTVLSMLFVNNKIPLGGLPSHFSHAGWGEGIHFADLIFPWFVLIMGISASFAASVNPESRASHYRRIFRRAAVLALLGCLINSSYASRPIWDFGVLQLIGFGYLVAALMAGLPGRVKFTVASIFLAAYWGLLRFAPIPDVGAGFFTKTINFARYVNIAFLEPIGLDGLLSIIPVSALALIGACAGDVLRNRRLQPLKKTLCLLSAGVVMMIAGWLWNLDIEFNKNLWTPAYVVFAAGTGLVVLAALYYLFDLRMFKTAAFPLVMPGKNALFAFVAPILINIYILKGWSIPSAHGNTRLIDAVHSVFTGSFGKPYGAWLYIFSYILLWWMILFVMYRKKVFLRV